MRRLIKKRSIKSGLLPGTLMHVDERKMDQIQIRTIVCDAVHIEEQVLQTVDEYFPPQDQVGVTWIDVDGLHRIVAVLMVLYFRKKRWL